MKKNKTLNKKEIIPNEKAAGIKLGAGKATVKKNWGEPVQVEEISLKVERLEYENASFWLESGKIDQISLCDLYEGKTNEKIGIGSMRVEVEDVYGSLEWDGSWHIQIPPFGIGFDFENDELGQQFVSEIYIFIQ